MNMKRCLVCSMISFLLALAILPACTQEDAGTAMYTADDIYNTSVDVFLNLMLNPEPGYHQHAAMRALIQKAKESDEETRAEILKPVVLTMQNPMAPILQRWQCCYVLSGSGDERSVMYLIQTLQNDISPVVRGTAAEALADFPQNKDAYDALVQASQQETDETVLGVLKRRLSQATPPPGSAHAPKTDETGRPLNFPFGMRLYTSAQIRAVSAGDFLERMLHPEPGFQESAAMSALAQKS